VKNLRLVINNEVKKKEKERFFIKRELQSILNFICKKWFQTARGKITLLRLE
jgi:hypothetical protein